MELNILTNYNNTVAEFFNGDIDGASNETLQDVIINTIAVSQNMRNYVNEFEIPKRKEGKMRKIVAPNDNLKTIHKQLVANVFSKYKPSKYAHGFVRKRGVHTNAWQHVGARSFGHLDIKNFFDNITKDHVKNILFGSYSLCKHCTKVLDMKSSICCPSIYRNLEGEFPRVCDELKWFSGQTDEDYVSLVNLITNLVTYKNKTPQGFATSPFIANIVLRKFDIIVGRRLEEYGIKYTRYADDMAFSHQSKSSSFLGDKVMKVVPSTLKLFKLKLNDEKTYFITNKSRMSACNVVINKRPNLKLEKRSLIRAKVHHATVKHATETTLGDLMTLRGEVAYFMMLNRPIGQKYMDQLMKFQKANFEKVDKQTGSVSQN